MSLLACLTFKSLARQRGLGGRRLSRRVRGQSVSVVCDAHRVREERQRMAASGGLQGREVGITQSLTEISPSAFSSAMRSMRIRRRTAPRLLVFSSRRWGRTCRVLKCVAGHGVPSHELLTRRVATLTWGLALRLRGIRCPRRAVSPIVESCPRFDLTTSLSTFIHDSRLRLCRATIEPSGHANRPRSDRQVEPSLANGLAGRREDGVAVGLELRTMLGHQILVSGSATRV